MLCWYGQVREFSAESAFHDPCLTYVLHDVMCSNCNATRDVDLARDTVRLRRDEGASLCVSPPCGTQEPPVDPVRAWSEY